MLLTFNTANAALFGASTFEECMNDGRVGRTNAELRILKNKCEKQFPKLQKLYSLKDANISCEGKDTNGIVNYRISKNKLSLSHLNSTFPILVRTKEKLLIKGFFLKNEKLNKDILATLTIFPLDGSAFIEVEGFISSMNCEES